MLWWDMGFLAFGVVLVIGGWIIQHGGGQFRVGMNASPQTRHA
jgi:uncharacterized membrane protein